ncbi:MAG: P1 family peptidase [Methylobacteriaceae bacterium]|jgi:L-aminopeptidase/D-esterase-like protein|nr:P1 family peptidase [Methylobacteriaceae bacterium]
MPLPYTPHPGPLNLITDVAGLTVGQADNAAIATGVTVFLFDKPAAAGAAFIGGGPGNRDTACLEPDAAVQGIDALVLSGGSGFGLDAATGVQAWLREHGRGLAVGPALVPIVPQAILFDLINGGNKDWGRFPPYRDLAYEAASRCSADFALGTHGAGYGATTVNFQGGAGSASVVTPSGFTVGAYAAVNTMSSAVMDNGPYFWASPFELNREFGGLGSPFPYPQGRLTLTWKGGPEFATTIAVVATDAVLTKPQARRLAFAAQGGLAKALRFANGFMDGDTVFAVATGRKPMSDEGNQMTELGALASDCLARAVARGVYEASALPFPSALPAWKDVFR